MGPHEGHVLRRVNRALGDHDAVVGNPLQQIERGLEAGLKGAQIAVVDTDEAARQAQGAAEFLTGWDTALEKN